MLQIETQLCNPLDKIAPKLGRTAAVNSPRKYVALRSTPLSAAAKQTLVTHRRRCGTSRRLTFNPTCSTP